MERRWQDRWLKKGAEKPGTALANILAALYW